MKSLNELNNLGKVVDEAHLKEINGGSNWKKGMERYFHNSQRFWNSLGNLIEGAAGGYGK